MIAKMLKAFAVARRVDRDALLEHLRSLGVVHIAPVDPERAVAAEQTAHKLDRAQRAEQILSTVDPEGPELKLPADEAIDQTLDIHRRSAEMKSRLSTLHRQMDELEIWGEVTLEELDALAQAGINPVFARVPASDAADVSGEFVATLRELPGDEVLLAFVDRSGQPEWPESAEILETPQRDRPSLRAEAHEIDRKLKRDAERLPEIAYSLPAVRKRVTELRESAEWSVAEHSAMDDEELFALQGWIPADKSSGLARSLEDADLDAAVHLSEPSEEEQPPTDVRYPKWALPIKGLFDILGTVPGYREYDLSGFFMLALPLFAAMLIGDAGYGLFFTVLPLLYYKTISRSMSKQVANLVLTFGLVTIVWGVMSANYFGVTPETIAQAEGFTKTVKGQTTGDVRAMLESDEGGAATLGRIMYAMAPLYPLVGPDNVEAVQTDLDQAIAAGNQARAKELRTELAETKAALGTPDGQAGRDLIIMISFIVGAIHLVSAQLRQALGVAPDIRFLANVGWAIFLGGMLGIVWLLFFPDRIWMPDMVMYVLLGGGAAMIVLFTAPGKNPVSMLGKGVMSNLLPMIGSFSDTMSYIRLMAVGMASYYIAISFNLLAGQVADGSTWVLAIPILLFGHLLNIGLAAIAIFAHGVRLNMLEFSNNAGVQWAGYAYAPFAKRSE